MRLGLHLSTAGGPERAAKEAARLGLDCLQIFAGSPRTWSSRPQDPQRAAAFAAGCRAAGLSPVVVHAPYLINLASDDDALWERSIAALADQLARAGALGCQAVVVHPGSRGGRSLEWGLDRAARAAARALAAAPQGVELWLENTAGGGGHLGGRLSELAGLLQRLQGLPAAACLDTAHAWGAGYRLDGPRALGRFLTRVQRTLGLEAVRLWHLNDTDSPLGSHRDRHQHLGRGLIGREGFGAIMRARRLAGAAGVMETPKNSRWADLRNLLFLRALAGNQAQ